MRTISFKIEDNSRIIIVLLCFVFFLLPFLAPFLFNISDLVNFFPLVIITSVVLFYGAFEHNIQLNKQSPNSNYVKPLSIIASFIFGFISFIIAFQTNILSEYDKNSNEEDNYKWFKTTQILSFPIDQYRNKTKPILQAINRIDSPQIQYYYFVVDKTNSIEKLKSYPGISDIIDNSPVANKYIFKKNFDSSLEDKILFYFLYNCVSPNGNIYTRSSAKNFIITIYNGTKCPVPLDKGIYRDKHSFSEITDLINDYIEKANELKEPRYKVSNQKTDIDSLINLVVADFENNFKDELDGKKYNLYILSDFNDDNLLHKQQPFEDNVNKLVSQGQLNKLSLIALPTKKVNAQSDSSKDLLREVCQNILFGQTAFAFWDLHNSKQLNSTIDDNVRNTVECSKEINFYYPYNAGLVCNSHQAMLYFNGFSDNVSAKLICENPDDNQSLMMNCHTSGNPDNIAIKPNFGREFLFNPKDTLYCTLNSQSSVINKNLFLKISDNKTKQYYKYRIVLLSILPSTTIFYLNLLYIIFIVCISLLIFLVCYLHIFYDSFHSLKIFSLSTHIPIKFLYLLLAGIILSFNIWYLNLLKDLPCYYWYFVILILLLFLVWHPFNNAIIEHKISRQKAVMSTDIIK